jgi:hypothetical protein
MEKGGDTAHQRISPTPPLTFIVIGSIGRRVCTSAAAEEHHSHHAHYYYCSRILLVYYSTTTVLCHPHDQVKGTFCLSSSSSFGVSRPLIFRVVQIVLQSTYAYIYQDYISYSTENSQSCSFRQNKKHCTRDDDGFHFQSGVCIDADCGSVDCPDVHQG